MALDVTEVGVWAASIDDKPGGLATKLDALAKAGADLEFVIARRAPDKPGTGVVFLATLDSPEETQAAQAQGFQVTESLHSVRAEGPDEPGLGGKITQAIAEAGINLRGLSAAAIGGKMVCYLALDTKEDAKKAVDALKAI
jgi:hypothetical protein